MTLEDRGTLIARARQRSIAGEAEEALAMLADVVARDPDAAAAHSALAEVLAGLGRLKPAAAAMRQATEIEPDNARLWIQLGAIQHRTGRYRQAAESWERALFLDPDNAAAFSNLSTHERLRGDVEIACWFGRRAVECDPSHADAWTSLGAAEGEAGRPANATAAFRRAIDLRPGDVEARRALGALAASPDAVAVTPFDPRAAYTAAIDAHRKKDDVAATHLFAAVLKVAKLKAHALNMLGIIALHANRNHRASIFFGGAERAGLKSSEFLTNHAISLRRNGAIDGAIARLETVIATSPTPESHLTLANIYRDACEFELSLANYRAAVALRPEFAKAHRGLANLMRDMHRPEESLAAFAHARALAPKDSELILDHAHAKLFAGDFLGGFRDYEHRWQGRESRPREFVEPRWNGEWAPGRVLLVHGEQGFGDNIQFVRFVDEAARRVGRVILAVRGPLVGLMMNLQTRQPLTVVEDGKPAGQFDLQIPMMSLPMALATTLASIPPPIPFRLDPARVQVWSGRFPSVGPKVGLIWQGNPKARADAGRSPPFAALAPLLSLPAHFVALQKTDGLRQLRQSEFSDRLSVPGDALGDFLETAHAVAAVDVVVSSCTATLHLAATIGKPVCGMLKYDADWRWLNETDTSPWYPSLRLFRQHTPGDWDSVVMAVRAVLAQRLLPS